MHNGELFDHIGSESSVDMKADVDFDPKPRPVDLNRRRRMKPSHQFKEYPPPIPSLSRTNNSPTTVLKRYYLPGRMIIVEEKIKKQEYLQAVRSNGRLVMKFVREVDDDVVEETVVEDGEGSSAGKEEEQEGPVVEKIPDVVVVGNASDGPAAEVQGTNVALKGKESEEVVVEEITEAMEGVNVEEDYEFGGGGGKKSCGGFGVAVTAFPPPLHT